MAPFSLNLGLGFSGPGTGCIDFLMLFLPLLLPLLLFLFVLGPEFDPN